MSLGNTKFERYAGAIFALPGFTRLSNHLDYLRPYLKLKSH